MNLYLLKNTCKTNGLSTELRTDTQEHGHISVLTIQIISGQFHFIKTTLWHTCTHRNHLPSLQRQRFLAENIFFCIFLKYANPR